MFTVIQVNPAKDDLCVCRSLAEEQALRRKAELESAQYMLKLQVVTNKYGQAQQELQVSIVTPFLIFL